MWQQQQRPGFLPPDAGPEWLQAAYYQNIPHGEGEFFVILPKNRLEISVIVYLGSLLNLSSYFSKLGSTGAAMDRHATIGRAAECPTSIANDAAATTSTTTTRTAISAEPTEQSEYGTYDSAASSADAAAGYGSNPATATCDP